MSHTCRNSRPLPATGSAPTTTQSSTLAAPKPVRPALGSMLQPPAQHWTAQPSPPGYTSFPPPPSPAPASTSTAIPSRVPSATPSSPGVGTAARMTLRSPGPNALTSFPPPPTPPDRNATSYFPSVAPKTPNPAPTAARIPPRPETTTPSPHAPPRDHAREMRPGVIDLDNLEETLHNLRFAPSPMLSTIYSAPSTPRDELSTPDFTASTASTASSCLTPPSTNPTPEPMTLPPPLKDQDQDLVTSSPARPRANSRRASPPTRRRARGRAVVSCIDSPVTFPTTWYHHPAAPDFPICSRCYDDHLLGTRLEHDFRAKMPDDDKPRVCRFSKPRVRDHLLPHALALDRGVDDLVSFLRRRSAIPDCRGVDGVHPASSSSSDPPTKWYRPRNNAIPNMVVCDACYEDHVRPHPTAAANFEPVAATQPANDVWVCDFALPFIQNTYRIKAAERNDWKGFTSDAVARMALPACAKRQRVAVGSRRWFAPRAAADLRGVLVCEACFSDHVACTGEESRWRDADADGGGGDDGLASRYGSLVHCALGHFNVGIAMSRAQETGDYAVFWTALAAVCREQFCDPRGIVDGKWYTFPSHPDEFCICAACVATIAGPLGLVSSLVPKSKCGRTAPGARVLCSFNPSSPRFVAYMTRLLEGFFVADTRALESYALEFASLPLCPRDEDFRDRRWYGWRGCTVCPSCYHEFARGTSLAAVMPLRGEVVAGSFMCEMYSPRMRSLYVEACARSPPDPEELLRVSKERRAVYFETVPAIRQMVMEAQVALGKVQGRGAEAGAAGLGLARQAGGKRVNSVAVEFGSGSRSFVMGQLEKRWRDVE